MESILSVHLELPKELSRLVLKARRSLGIESADEPHLTLYLASLSKPQAQKVGRELAKLRVRSGVMYLSKIATTKGNQPFISIPVRETSALYELHKLALAAANAHRGGSLRKIDRHRIKLGLYSTQEKEYAQKYGYPKVLKLFRPHISIGTAPAANPRLRRSIKGLSMPLPKKFRPSAMIVALYDFDGQTGAYLKKTFEKRISLL
jgi:hypothetical protein